MTKKSAGKAVSGRRVSHARLSSPGHECARLPGDRRVFLADVLLFKRYCYVIYAMGIFSLARFSYKEMLCSVKLVLPMVAGGRQGSADRGRGGKGRGGRR